MGMLSCRSISNQPVNDEKMKKRKMTGELLARNIEMNIREGK